MVSMLAGGCLEGSYENPGGVGSCCGYCLIIIFECHCRIGGETGASYSN